MTRFDENIVVLSCYEYNFLLMPDLVLVLLRGKLVLMS